MQSTAQRIEPERQQQRISERQGDRRLERPSMTTMTGDGRFALDLSRIPKGFTMEWKRHSLMGADDRENRTLVARYHWQPVPHKLQPHILGHTGTDENEHIVVGGMGLYMRPTYLNDDAQEEYERSTAYNTQQQLTSLRLQSKEQVGERYTKIKKTRVAVPADES